MVVINNNNSFYPHISPGCDPGSHIDRPNHLLSIYAFISIDYKLSFSANIYIYMHVLKRSYISEGKAILLLADTNIVSQYNYCLVMRGVLQ